MLNIIGRIRQFRKERYLMGLVERGLVLGNDVQIHDGVFIDPSHCFLITIEDRCVLAPCVRLIAHDASLFRFVGITRIGRITIGENCFLGDSAQVLPGVKIGPDSIIGAGSIVTKDIPPGSVAAGNPARVICSLSEFLEKHQHAKRMTRTFHEKDYGIASISEERKREMLEVLKHASAYMEGEV
jgi:maltose O-acetyltransferase